MKYAMTAVALILMAGCSAPAAAPAPAGTSSPPSTSPTTDDAANVATLTVTTTGPATVTWGTSGGTSQDEIKKNWTKKVELKEAFDVVTVSVVGVDYNKSVSVSCEIVINGESKAKQSGKGKLASANCTTSA